MLNIDISNTSSPYIAAKPSNLASSFQLLCHRRVSTGPQDAQRRRPATKKATAGSGRKLIQRRNKFSTATHIGFSREMYGIPRRRDTIFGRIPLCITPQHSGTNISVQIEQVDISSGTFKSAEKNSRHFVGYLEEYFRSPLHLCLGI